MDGKSFGGDVGHISLDAPVVFPVYVKAREPDNDLWRGGIRLCKSNRAGCGDLRLVPGVIVRGAEAPRLEVTVVGRDLEPFAAGRVENGITPGVNVDLCRVLVNAVDVCFDSKVPGTIDVERSEADGEMGGGAG